MPHYKDREEAKVGDVVCGESINKGWICGIVVEVTAGRESCNLVVAFNFSGVWDNSSFPEWNMKNRLEFLHEIACGRRRRVMIIDDHLMTGGNISRDGIFVGGTGKWMTFETDYGDANKFMKFPRRDEALLAKVNAKTAKDKSSERCDGIDDDVQRSSTTRRNNGPRRRKRNSRRG